MILNLSVFVGFFFFLQVDFKFECVCVFFLSVHFKFESVCVDSQSICQKSAAARTAMIA